jgi:hypothetical protein
LQQQKINPALKLHFDGITGWYSRQWADTWNCGISKEKVSFNWDLISGICVHVIDRPRVSLDSIIQFRASASLDIKTEINHSMELRTEVHVLFTAVSQGQGLCLALLGTQ